MIEFRKARPSDFARVAELKEQVHSEHVRNSQGFYKDVEHPLAEAEYKALLDSVGKQCAYVLLDGSQIVGYAFTQTLECENHPIINDQKQLFLDDLCVDETLRGRGYGRRLMQEIVRVAEESGCGSVELNVWNWNVGAIEFYKAIGMGFTRLRMKKDLQTPKAV